MNSICEYIKTNNICCDITVEIGVAAGTNAKNMLENLPIKKMYLIDHYQPSWDKNRYTEGYINTYNDALTNLKPYWDKIVFYKEPFQTAVTKIPDNINYIYYDAMGKYTDILNFFTNYYKKIVQNGIISGKYYNDNYHDLKIVIDVFQTLHNNDKFINFDDNYWLIIKKEL